MRYFMLYLVVGGMPAAVQKYVDTNDLAAVVAEQRFVIRAYRRDISKYDPDHALRIREIYDLLPSELASENKRFKLSGAVPDSRFSRGATGSDMIATVNCHRYAKQSSAELIAEGAIS
jgi:hypothetical protein